MVEKIYKNGAVFDTEKGRIVAMRPELAQKNTTITRENTAEYLSKRLDKKRARIEAGAMAAVSEKMPDAFTGDDGDWIEAVAQQVAYKALDKLDPKQVDAARFLFTEAGIAEQRQPVQGGAAEAVTDILREVASIAAALAHGYDNYNYRKHEVEGTVIDDEQGQAGADEAGGG